MGKEGEMFYTLFLINLDLAFDAFTRHANKMGVSEEQQTEDVGKIFDRVLVPGSIVE